MFYIHFGNEKQSLIGVHAKWVTSCVENAAGQLLDTEESGDH